MHEKWVSGGLHENVQQARVYWHHVTQGQPGQLSMIAPPNELKLPPSTHWCTHVHACDQIQIYRRLCQSRLAGCSVKYILFIIIAATKVNTILIKLT